MKTIQDGARQAVHVCMNVKAGEAVVLITDNPTKHLAQAVKDELESAQAKPISFFLMEDFGTRSLDGSDPLVFPEEIAKALQSADVSFYMASSMPGELQTFRSPMCDVVNANPKLRHAHMPGINDEIMKTGMAADYARIKQLTAAVFECVSDAKEITVTTPAGTNLRSTFCYRWCESSGFIKPDRWENLPGAEVFTCPDRIEGTAVIDGIFGDYFAGKYGELSKNPITFEIKDSRVTSVHCEREDILEDVKTYISQDENANRIGEFAIGTNIGLTSFVGVLLQDEKFPGVHIAVGDGYPEKTGSPIRSKAHSDGVMRSPTIIVDGKTIMKDGTFLLES